MTDDTASAVVLDTSEKYFTEILRPEVRSFFDNPSTFRAAFNVARSLFHYHEWIYEDHRAALEEHFGKALAKKADFWGQVEAAHQAHGFIRDFANASKHVRLTLRPSTSMRHIANTAFQVMSAGSTEINPAVFGASGLQMKDGDVNVSFDFCADTLYKYWEDLREKLPS